MGSLFPALFSQPFSCVFLQAESERSPSPSDNAAALTGLGALHGPNEHCWEKEAAACRECCWDGPQGIVPL